VRHGKGKYISLNGRVYKGEFKDGAPNGKGQINWPDGRSYKGNVINNSPDYEDKHAIWKWSNGKIYHGSLPNDFGEGDLDAFSEDETIHSDDDDDDEDDDYEDDDYEDDD